MKTSVQIGVIVVAVAVFARVLSGRGTDAQVDIPAMIEAGALLIDVRTKGEFDKGHLPGARNIPFDTIGREIGNHTEKKDYPIILYCHSGSRAVVAKKTLNHFGYTNVVNGGSLNRMRKLLAK